MDIKLHLPAINADHMLREQHTLRHTLEEMSLIAETKKEFGTRRANKYLRHIVVEGCRALLAKQKASS